MTYDDLPEAIPVFPLAEVLLLPNGELPLNIFEEKYIHMVDDVLGSHRLIGMIQPDTVRRSKGHEGAIMSTGCAGRITQFSETEDHRYLIMLTGVTRFDVIDEMATVRPYRMAKIDWNPYQDDMVEDCDTIEIDRETFLPLLKRYFALHQMECDWTIIRQSPCETLLTTLPMICPFDAQEKQALLEAKTMDKRYETLTAILTLALNNRDNKESSALQH